MATWIRGGQPVKGGRRWANLEVRKAGGGRQAYSIREAKFVKKSVREDGGRNISGKGCGRCDPCVSPCWINGICMKSVMDAKVRVVGGVGGGGGGQILASIGRYAYDFLTLTHPLVYYAFLGGRAFIWQGAVYSVGDVNAIIYAMTIILCCLNQLPFVVIIISKEIFQVLRNIAPFFVVSPHKKAR